MVRAALRGSFEPGFYGFVNVVLSPWEIDMSVYVVVAINVHLGSYGVSSIHGYLPTCFQAFLFFALVGLGLFRRMLAFYCQTSPSSPSVMYVYIYMYTYTIHMCIYIHIMYIYIYLH